MSAGNQYGFCSGFLQDANCTGDGSAGINHVIEKDAVLSLDFTDNAVGDYFIRNVNAAGLVYESHWGVAEVISPLLSNFHPASIRRNNGEVIQGVLGLDVGRQPRM